MQSEQRGAAGWGLALTAAVHAALWWSVSQADGAQHAVSGTPGRVTQVTLIAAPAPPAPALASPSELAPPPLAALEMELAPPADAARAEIRFYRQEELQRQVIVLRDATGEAEIALPPAGVVMHLFIDAQGKVAAISFEDGAALGAALQDQLRSAFETLEFLPGIKDGQVVPSRIKIRLSGAGATAP